MCTGNLWKHIQPTQFEGMKLSFNLLSSASDLIWIWLSVIFCLNQFDSSKRTSKDILYSADFKTHVVFPLGFLLVGTLGCDGYYGYNSSRNHKEIVLLTSPGHCIWRLLHQFHSHLFRCYKTTKAEVHVVIWNRNYDHRIMYSPILYMLSSAISVLVILWPNTYLALTPTTYIFFTHSWIF